MVSRRDEVVEVAKLGGRFDIGEGRSVPGELSIRGADTSLYLHDADFFHVGNNHAECIRGTLHDAQRSQYPPTRCVLASGPSRASQNREW